MAAKISRNHSLAKYPLSGSAVLIGKHRIEYIVTARLNPWRFRSIVEPSVELEVVESRRRC